MIAEKQAYIKLVETNFKLDATIRCYSLE